MPADFSYFSETALTVCDKTLENTTFFVYNYYVYYAYIERKKK